MVMVMIIIIINSSNGVLRVFGTLSILKWSSNAFPFPLIALLYRDEVLLEMCTIAAARTSRPADICETKQKECKSIKF
jgi:hypothetical protein